MVLNQFKNGLEEHASQILACIASSGLHIRHEPTFSYTVGFAALGLPELVVGSLPVVHADELLRTLWTAAHLADDVADDWGSLGKTLKPNPTFVPLTEEKRRHIFCDARTYYGNWKFQANAVFLSDGRA